MIYSKCLLEFRECRQAPVAIHPILFVNENFEVLFGNFAKDYLGNYIECILVPRDYAIHLKKWLIDLEEALLNENSIRRFHEMEEELLSLMKNEINDDELFETDKQIETIDEIEFEKPANFKFKKKKKKKGDDDDNLFSGFGE